VPIQPIRVPGPSLLATYPPARRSLCHSQWRSIAVTVVLHAIIVVKVPEHNRANNLQMRCNRLPLSAIADGVVKEESFARTRNGAIAVRRLERRRPD
jgi:hypothetical protein